MRRAAIALAVCLPFAARASEPFFPARSGESGILDVPDARVVGPGRGMLGAELRFDQPSRSSATTGPLPVYAVAGITERIDLGLSMREWGQPGDPAPGRMVYGAAGKLQLVEGDAGAPAFALDLLLDRINTQSVGGGRLITSADLHPALHAAAFVGAETGLSGARETGVTWGAALALRASKDVSAVLEGLGGPRGENLGAGVRWSVRPTLGIQLGFNYLPSDDGFRVSLGVAMRPAPERRAAPVVPEVAPEAKAPVVPSGPVFADARPRFRLRAPIAGPDRLRAPRRLQYPGTSPVASSSPPARSPPSAGPSKTGQSPSSGAPAAKATAPVPAPTPVAALTPVPAPAPVAALTPVPAPAPVTPSAPLPAPAPRSASEQRTPGDARAAAPKGRPAFVLVVKAPTSIVKAQVAAPSARAADAALHAGVGVDKAVVAATVVTFASSSAALPELDREGIDAVAKLAAKERCELLVWARAKDPSLMGEAQRRAAEIKARAVASGPLDEKQVVTRITTRPSAERVDVLVSALRDPTRPAAAAAARPAPSRTLESGEGGKRQIRAGVIAAQGSIEACVGEHIEARNLRHAEGVLTLTISSEGRVEKISTRRGDLSGEDLDACLGGASRTWTFPPADAGYVVDVPITAVGGGAAR